MSDSEAEAAAPAPAASGPNMRVRTAHTGADLLRGAALEPPPWASIDLTFRRLMAARNWQQSEGPVASLHSYQALRAVMTRQSRTAAEFARRRRKQPR